MMTVRRAIAMAAGFMLAFGLLMSGSAEAQQSPETTVEVEEEEVTRTTQAASPPEVRGDVVSRPLPRTGTDLNGTAMFGGALTIVGVALALGARRRRNSFESV